MTAVMYKCDHEKIDFFNRRQKSSMAPYKVDRDKAPSDMRCPICRATLVRDIGSSLVWFSDFSKNNDSQTVTPRDPVKNDGGSNDPVKNDQGGNDPVRNDQGGNSPVDKGQGSNNPDKNNPPVPDKKIPNVPFSNRKNKTVVKLIGQENLKEEIESLIHAHEIKDVNESAKNVERYRDMENIHYVIAGEELCGKSTACDYLIQKLKSAGIANKKETVMLKVSDFGRAYSNGINEKQEGTQNGSGTSGNKPELKRGLEGLQELTKSLSNCVVYFDESFDELFRTPDGTIETKKQEIMKDMYRFLSSCAGRFTLIMECSEPVYTALFKSNEKMRDVLEGFVLDKYTIEEMMTITENVFSQGGFYLEEDAKSVIRNQLVMQSFDTKNPMGRFIKQTFEKAKRRQATRIAKGGNGAYDMIKKEDFKVGNFDEERLQKALKELDSLVGLDNVKKRMHEFVNTQRINLEKEKNGQRAFTYEFMNMLFVGSPGTGKTTIAELVAEIMYAMGLLSKAKVVTTSGSDLDSPYVGAATDAIRQKFEEAKGGVLFIDEAYELIPTNSSGKTEMGGHGQQILDTLTELTAKYKYSVCVILAGYEDKIKQLLSNNVGLSSRFPHVIHFEDYSEEELFKIYKSCLKKEGIQVGSGCDDLMHIALRQAMSDPTFQNARGVKNFIGKLVEQISARSADELNKGQTPRYSLLCKEDLEAFVNDKTQDDTLEGLLKQLDSKIGLKEVKEFIHRMVNVEQGKKNIKAGYDITLNDARSYNLTFLGPSGTGKTSIARLVAKIYARLGITKKEVFVEVNARELIGQYIGHTEQNVKKVIEEASGGVLFIDEVYALGTDAFGTAALNTLLTAMDGKGRDLIVIFAGYKEEMLAFMKTNQGIKGRFSRMIEFTEYNEEELVKIFCTYLEKRLSIPVPSILLPEIHTIVRNMKANSACFSNARDMENLADNVANNVMARMADPSENYCLKAGDLIV